MLSLLAIPYAWLVRHTGGAVSTSGKKHSADKLHGDSPHFEFAGPPGAVAMLVCLPLLVFALYFGCNADQCVSLNPSV